MIESIKKRIEAVRRGEVPEGYIFENHQLRPEGWQYEKIGNFLVAYDEFSNDTGAYPLATSSRQGLMLQSEYYNDQRYEETTGGFHVVPEGYVTYRHMSDDDIFRFNVNRMGTPVLVSPEYPVFTTSDGLCQDLLIAYLNNMKEFTAYCSAQKKGSTRTRMYFSRLGEFVMPIPPASEQKKIAEILATCDRVIELKQCKIDELNKLKQTYLRKMFPQKGKTVPEIRFPDFSDPWEQRKLGDVCQITMGQSPDGDTYSDVPSDYILVQGNADLKNGWVCPRIWTTQKIKTAEAGDLIMSVRAPAGAMGKTNYNVVLGRGVAGIKGNEFIFQTLVKMYEDGYWKKLAAGSTFESINSDVISNAEIAVPQDVAEQEKLGAYFRNLDNLITLHQRELEEYGKYKKALMQLLLTGLVRVNA